MPPRHWFSFKCSIFLLATIFRMRVRSPHIVIDETHQCGNQQTVISMFVQRVRVCASEWVHTCVVKVVARFIVNRFMFSSDRRSMCMCVCLNMAESWSSIAFDFRIFRVHCPMTNDLLFFFFFFHLLYFLFDFVHGRHMAHHCCGVDVDFDRDYECDVM